MPKPDVQMQAGTPGGRPSEPGAPDAVPRAQERNRREFEETALPHLDALYGIALKLCRDSSEAEDLVQETFVRAYRYKELGTILSGPAAAVWPRLSGARGGLRGALGGRAGERGLGGRPGGPPSPRGRPPAAVLRP